MIEVGIGLKFFFRFFQKSVRFGIGFSKISRYRFNFSVSFILNIELLNIMNYDEL